MMVGFFYEPSRIATIITCCVTHFKVRIIIEQEVQVRRNGRAIAALLPGS